MVRAIRKDGSGLTSKKDNKRKIQKYRKEVVFPKLETDWQGTFARPI